MQDANSILVLQGTLLKHNKSLKHKVHDLIDSNVISFTPNGPNANNNPIPPHTDHSMSMLEEFGECSLVSKVDKMKTSLIMVKEKLLLNDMFPGCMSDCK